MQASPPPLLEPPPPAAPAPPPAAPAPPWPPAALPIDALVLLAGDVSTARRSSIPATSSQLAPARSATASASADRITPHGTQAGDSIEVTCDARIVDFRVLIEPGTA
jgi:hypothetical protein